MESKRFYLYKDNLSILKILTNEQAGVFIKSIYEYQVNNKLPDVELAIKVALVPFINQFERDQQEYKKTCDRNKLNGTKGGRPENPKNPSGLFENPLGAYKDKDKDTDTNNKEKINKKENLELEISDFSLSEQEAIKNWLTYKKEKRQAYKPTALNTLINQIRKEKQNGCDIVAVLNISMFNNWAGLFFKNGYKLLNINERLKNCNDQDFSQEIF